MTWGIQERSAVVQNLSIISCAHRWQPWVLFSWNPKPQSCCTNFASNTFCLLHLWATEQCETDSYDCKTWPSNQSRDFTSAAREGVHDHLHHSSLNLCDRCLSAVLNSHNTEMNESSRAKKHHLGMIQVYKTVLICCLPSCTVPAWPVPE